MAINVNTVYTTVLAILNKEQRGYLTPFEFNTLAEQVQLEIFEKYFEDLNVVFRTPQNSTEFADRVKTLEEKIATFETSAAIAVTIASGFGEYDFSAQDPKVHRFGDVEFQNGSLLPVTIEKVSKHELLMARRSQLTSPTSSNPMCFIEGSKIKILPAIASAGSVNGSPVKIYTLDYVKKPAPPVWGFTVGAVGQYIYATAASTDFEISNLDQAETVLKILAYAGVVVRDSEITQAAASQAAVIDQQQIS